VARDNAIPFSPFTSGLIRNKARRLAKRTIFADMEVADIEQELVLRLLPALDQFDANAGHLNGYVFSVLSRLVASLIRERSMQKRQPNGLCFLEAAIRTGVPEPPNPASGDDLTDLKIDVAEILALLPPDLRDLAERMKTQTLAEVARDLKAPRSTLHRRVERLRQRFEDRGLDVYL
jgi:RNA polymerase sigma factor (sigma-70 family)